TRLQIGPRQVAERLPARGNVALRTEAIQMERRRARADLLDAHDMFQIVGEDKTRGIVVLLRIKLRECALPTRPEPPFPVVRALVHVLLDRYRAIRRRLGVFRFDRVTGGWTRWLRGGRADTPDTDRADNEHFDQRLSDFHFLVPLTRSAISRVRPDSVH